MPVDHSQSELDVPEQLALVGRSESGPAPELDGPSDVVDERGREQQVGPEPRMELRRLPAQRRDADGVLEQAAGVRVVAVGRGGVLAQVAPGKHRAGPSQ